MTLVKICGITTPGDAQAAVEAGADALGFNFWPGSPRYLSTEAAAKIMADVPAGVWKVGVFVDTTAEEADRCAVEAGLDVVQFHGSVETAPRTRFWQAVTAGEAGWRETMEASAAEAILLDAPSGARRGGSGVPFDWSLASGLPYRIVLAGGLSPENVAEAIRLLRPWGVDACSRLESSPGRKDPAKMRAFVAAVRETGS